MDFNLPTSNSQFDLGSVLGNPTVWGQSGTASERAQTSASRDIDAEMEPSNQPGAQIILYPDLTANAWQVDESAMASGLSTIDDSERQASETETDSGPSDVDCDSEMENADEIEVEDLLHRSIGSSRTRDAVRVVPELSSINN
jgi:hypothetical protein